MNIGISIGIDGDTYGDLSEGGVLDVVLREDGFSVLREDGSNIVRET